MAMRNKSIKRKSTKSRKARYMGNARKNQRDDFTEVGILFPTQVKRTISNAIVLKLVRKAKKKPAPAEPARFWPDQSIEEPARSFITTVSTSGTAQ